MEALDVLLRGLDVGEMEHDDITQSTLNESMSRMRSGGVVNRSHQNAYSAKGCSHEISLESWTLDAHLSPSELVNTVSRRLGVDVVDSGRHCSYRRMGYVAFRAWQVRTPRRSTALFETSALCERAGLRPISETPTNSPGYFHA